MLDKLGKKLLIKLRTMCNSDGYSILEVSDILSQMTNKLSPDMLEKYIELLSHNEYIDVKYMDSKQICMAILPKSRNIESVAKSVKGVAIGKTSIVIIAIVAMLGAFVGTVLANLILGA